MHTGTFMCGRVRVAVTITPDLSRSRLPAWRVDASSAGRTVSFDVPLDTRESAQDVLARAADTALVILTWRGPLPGLEYAVPGTGHYALVREE
jgi:hypothetical protein